MTKMVEAQELVAAGNKSILLMERENMGAMTLNEKRKYVQIRRVRYLKQEVEWRTVTQK